jgi:hypothetical protein
MKRFIEEQRKIALRSGIIAIYDELIHKEVTLARKQELWKRVEDIVKGNEDRVIWAQLMSHHRSDPLTTVCDLLTGRAERECPKCGSDKLLHHEWIQNGMRHDTRCCCLACGEEWSFRP